MKILVTGSAGFIGYHACKSLIDNGHEIIGVDNLNDYYDVSLKNHRISLLKNYKNFDFYKIEIQDYKSLESLFNKYKFKRVLHLAAQAGVRHSIENPSIYIHSNIHGFLNILEACRHNNIEHLVYASSSSVYGLNQVHPYNENHSVNHPVSLYGATKKSNELMAHSYSELYNLPTTGLRYFTVYGPLGRPDMSPMIFADSIINEKPIKVYNNGKHKRDFTYIDDVVDGTIKILDKIPKSDNKWSGLKPSLSSSSAPWRIFNIGNNQPVELLKYIECLEKYLGKKAIKEMLPLQPGDMQSTFADVDALKDIINYQPKIDLDEGIKNFCNWYKDYFKY